MNILNKVLSIFKREKTFYEEVAESSDSELRKQIKELYAILKNLKKVLRRHDKKMIPIEKRARDKSDKLDNENQLLDEVFFEGELDFINTDILLKYFDNLEEYFEDKDVKMSFDNINRSFGFDSISRKINTAISFVVMIEYELLNRKEGRDIGVKEFNIDGKNVTFDGKIIKL